VKELAQSVPVELHVLRAGEDQDKFTLKRLVVVVEYRLHLSTKQSTINLCQPTDQLLYYTTHYITTNPHPGQARVQLNNVNISKQDN